MSRKDSIQARQNKLKEVFLEQLKRTPNIETACQKVGVARATVYRWIKASKRFEKQIDECIAEGRLFMVDVTESQLFSLVGERKFEAIRFFLSTHSPRYGNKLEITGNVNTREVPLTKEQRKLIRDALRKSTIRSDDKKKPKDTA